MIAVCLIFCKEVESKGLDGGIFDFRNAARFGLEPKRATYGMFAFVLSW